LITAGVQGANTSMTGLSAPHGHGTGPLTDARAGPVQASDQPLATNDERDDRRRDGVVDHDRICEALDQADVARATASSLDDHVWSVRPSGWQKISRLSPSASPVGCPSSVSFPVEATGCRSAVVPRRRSVGRMDHLVQQEEITLHRTVVPLRGRSGRANGCTATRDTRSRSACIIEIGRS
jgi:hypothetical protein